MSLIPGSGRSYGGGTGNPWQYSCLENPMDRGAWWVTVSGVAESDMTGATWHSVACVWHISLQRTFMSIKADPHLHHRTCDNGVRLQTLAFPQFSTGVFTLCSVSEAYKAALTQCQLQIIHILKLAVPFSLSLQMYSLN